MALIIKLTRKTSSYMLESVGAYKVEIHWSIYFNTTKMVYGVPSSHICIIIGYGSFIGTKYHREK
jgi:hypothetical protein